MACSSNHLGRAQTIELKPNAFREFERVFVPEGHRESSRAFQRREHVGCGASPEGTAETPFPFAFQPTLRDSNRRGCEPSVEALGCCRLSLRDNCGQTQSEFPKGIKINTDLFGEASPDGGPFGVCRGQLASVFICVYLWFQLRLLS